MACRLEDRSYMVPVFRQGAETKITRNAVKIPNFCFGFEKAGHDLAGLFLEIGVIARISNNRHTPFRPVERFSHYVEVLTGLERHIDTDRFREVTCPHSSRHYN